MKAFNNDVIHYALKVICDKNLERSRKFGDRKFSLESWNCVGVFGDIGKFGDIGPAMGHPPGGFPLFNI
jgi:hypothetical protein